MNVPQQLLSRGSFMRPGDTCVLDRLVVSAERELTFRLFRSSFEGPPFFAFEQMLPLYAPVQFFSRSFGVSFDGLSRQQRLQLSQPSLRIEVHLAFDYRKFRPNPIVEVFALTDANELLLLQEIEIWDWYTQGFDEEQVLYEHIPKHAEEE